MKIGELVRVRDDTGVNPDWIKKYGWLWTYLRPYFVEGWATCRSLATGDTCIFHYQDLETYDEDR